jgi:hypothetical protein
MRRRIGQLAVITLALGSLGACGGGGGSDPSPGGPAGGDTLRATIQGQAWAADAGRLVVQDASTASAPGSLRISGSQIASPTSFVTLRIDLAFIGGPGTLPLGVNGLTTAGGGGGVDSQQGTTAEFWATQLSGAAGTATITSLSATRVAGTFAFTAAALPGTTGSRTVTAGTFDVALPSGFAAAPASNPGSSVSASLDGAAWNAATVVGSQGGPGVFSVSAINTSRQFTLLPTSPITAPGTVLIGGGVRLTLIDQVTGTAWGGTGADTGTVTFTTVPGLSGGRATGTFSGTLAPIGAAGPPVVVTGGTFDVRIVP